MKHLRILLVLLTASLAVAPAALQSCKESDAQDYVVPTAQTAETISQGLDVPAGGGIYTLEFAHSPEQITVKCDDAGHEGWLDMEIESRTFSTLSLYLKVSPNTTGTSRETSVELTSGTAVLLLQVRQDAE